MSLSMFMRRFISNIRLILLGVGVLFPLRVRGDGELPEIRQITTHPLMDFSPAVSPDGRWLAFTSERSGNLDIWVKKLPRERPVRVTTHQAEDSYPVWSPDGRHLAFISKRRDAQGDIWFVTLDLKKGGAPKDKPIQLTQYLGLDQKPSFSPDGKRIVFMSDRDGEPNLWIVDVGLGGARQLTTRGGMDPAWSPTENWILFTSYRYDPGGDLFLIDAEKAETDGMEERIVYPITWGKALDGQGSWSPDGKEAVFLRFDRDTDRDGKVTPADNGSLWQKRLAGKEEAVSPHRISMGRDEIQMTTEVFRDSEPCWSRSGEILFTSFRGGGMDVWSIPQGGIFARAGSAVEQYTFILDKFGESVTEAGLFQSVLGYTRVWDYFSTDSVWVARSLIQMGEIFRVLGELDRAKSAFEAVGRDYPSQSREVALAELKLAALTRESMEVRIERCLGVIQSFPEESSVIAEAWLVLGDLYREIGEVGQSLVAYGRVIQSFPELQNLKAQAQLKIGDLLRTEGQDEQAKQSYSSVLREAGNVPLWRKRAGGRLLGLIQGSPDERIRGYQQIIQEVSDLPSLVAEAQLSIGRILMEQNQNEQALRELERIEEIVPTLLWAHAEAKILQAKVHGNMGDELKGILLLGGVIDSYGSVEGGYYASAARETLFSLLFDSAERLRTSGDPVDLALAEARYRRAMELRSDDVRIHRGLAETMYRRGRAGELIQEYEKKREDRPKDPILLYGLGLAYSYLGEARPEYLKRSNDYLIQALEEDYRLIYPYRTLSFNYELLERLAEEKARRRSSLIVRIGRTVLAPVRWVFGLLPFGGEEKREGYYEAAIQALVTAMELNDERSDPRMEALLAQNLANNFYHLGEYAYKRAYQYYQTRLSLDSTFTQLLEKAIFFERAGHCGVVLEDTETAARYLLGAIQIYTDLGREEDAIRNLHMLAFLYHLAGRYEDAISVYEKTVVRDERLERWNEVGLGYRNIAYNYTLMGEPEDALKYAEKAERILQRNEIPVHPPKKNSLRIEVFGFSIPVWSMEEIGGASAEGFTLAEEAALVYGLMSRNFETLKSYRDAVGYEYKRLEIFEKRKDSLAERVTLNRLGVLHYKLSDYEKAWDFFYLAWEKCKKKKDDRGRWINAVDLGNVVTAELSMHENEIHIEESMRCLEEELKKYSSDEVNAFRRERLPLLSMLGTLWILRAKKEKDFEGSLREEIENSLGWMRDLGRAESYFQEGVILAEEGGFWREEGILLKNLAEVAELVGDDRLALQRLQKSRRLLERSGEEDLLWRSLYSMANFMTRIPEEFRPLHDAEDDPLACYEEAMDKLENLPVQEEGSEERLSDRKDRWSLYVDAASEMVRRGMVEEALETVERAREKQVADLLARRPPQLKRERHKIAWGNVRYLRSRLQEIRTMLLEEEAGERGDFTSVELNKEKERYETEYRELLESIGEEDRVLAYLVGAEPIELENVQSLLPSDGVALCYLIDSDQTLLWVVDRDTVILTTLEVGKSTLQDKVEEFLRRVRVDSLVDETSRELYDILLRPVASLIEEKTTVIVVPDGLLWDVPFGVLSDGEEVFIEKCTLVYAPSLTAYRLALERRRINKDDGLLVGDIDDSSFQVPMKRATKTVQALLGPRATGDAFREVVQSSDVVQVERWMLTNEKDPMTSSLVLFPGEKGDEFLRVEDLFSCDLKASLFFLPPSRRGTRRGYRGSLAFIHGLLYSGVPSVMMNIWPVARDAKQRFAEEFYKNFREMSVSDALAEAQLAVRESHPELVAWGGFQLVGFGGMDSSERIRFAERNLGATVMEGRLYEQGGEYEDAVNVFEKALDMAEAMGDSFSVQRIHEEILRVSVESERWETAIEYQIRMQRAAEKRGDREEVLRSVKNLLGFYRRNGQFDKAAQAKIEYIRLMEEEGNVEEVVSSYEDLAYIYTLGREYQSAVTWVNKAKDFYEERRDSLGQARAYMLRGRFELDGDFYWEAHSDLLTGITMLESRSKTTPMDEKTKIDLASGYQLLGLTCEKLARYEEALDYQEKGLALFTELNMSNQTAQGFQYLANLYWERGDFRQGLSYQEKALTAFESMGNRKLLAVALSTQGLIYMGLGDLLNARKAEERALDMAEKDNQLVDQATILKNMGLVAIQEKDLVRAYQAFYRASQIDSSLGFRWGLAYDYRNMGALLVLRGRLEGGIAFLEKGLRLSREIGDRRNEVQCLYRLGQAHGQSGDQQSAVAVLDSGIAVSANLVIPDIRWRIFRQRARVLEVMGRDQEALVDYRVAVDIVENMRAELKVEAFKQGFLDNKMDLYVDVVRHLLRMNKPNEAFNFIERAKSRNFIDLLGNQDLILAEAQGDLLDRERAARLAVQEALERLGSIETKDQGQSRSEQEEKRNWENELEERRKAYEAVLTSIQAESPELASFVDVDPWDSERIQDILPDSTALVEYFLTEEELFCWTVLPEMITVEKVDVQGNVIRESVKRFRETIQAHLSADREGRELYGWLVQPIEKKIRSVRHIIFVPHGVLHYLPFAALQDEEGSYLIERYSLSLVPSATVLGYCREKERYRKDKKKVLALSNPDLGNARYDLPFAEKEVISLQRTFDEVSTFFGGEVTERVVRNMAGSYDMIHFACHGTYEAESPLFSALLLSPEEEDDGRLEAHEIFGLNLNCDLVTLSACETGLAQITKGDEIIGLARSFIFAGTPSIVTSLWKVDDLATAVMVKRFYRYIRAGYPKAEALRRAQLLVKEGVNGHPAAWAAFGLTGDFQ